jgi:hypothetical protein
MSNGNLPSLVRAQAQARAAGIWAVVPAAGSGLGTSQETVKSVWHH